jgi:hypothetical protein
VLLLAACTGAATYAFASKGPAATALDDARRRKFSTPQYASMRGMEAVSAQAHLLGGADALPPRPWRKSATPFPPTPSASMTRT